MTDITKNLSEIIINELKVHNPEIVINETQMEAVLSVLNSLQLLNKDHYQAGVAIGEANIETLKAKLLVASTIAEQLPDSAFKKNLLKTLKA